MHSSCIETNAYSRGLFGGRATLKRSIMRKSPKELFVIQRYLAFVILFIPLLVFGAVQLPTTPALAPIPSFKEVTGPGPLFTALLRLPADEDLGHFKYIVKEYFVSGTAQGKPYTTRILVRRPSDAKKF